ncbi:hypothetical protein MKW92_044646 [Papaver armeniacum]|nr:hypothetical protein MKW92_044646 [Papaver armeniacum]
MHAAEGCFCHLQTIFQELDECRGFELLKRMVVRANYPMTKQANIVAMTCTHAALKGKDFLQLGFMYNNLLMEESAQILEIETFISMLLQRQEYGYARLKRSILIGDHHQLPLPHGPELVYKICSSRCILNIELTAQGRARPNITKLYNWRCRDLGGLPIEREQAIFHTANAGFAYDHQLVDVPDYNGRGESAPSPWFYQNEGEAENYLFVMLSLNVAHIPSLVHLTRFVPETILFILCQQNDFILLSLVRTRFAGHLRDVRRLIVATSRARLGIYVFCRRSLFEQCYELQPTFKLLQRPDQLGLNFDETTSVTERDVGDTGRASFVSGIEEMDSIVDLKMRQAYEAYQVNHS